LITRLERDALTAEDRRVLVKVLTFYFWLVFAVREAKLSLKRLKTLGFGEKPKRREPPDSGGTGGSGGSGSGTATAPGGVSTPEQGAPEVSAPPAGHGRQGAAVYRAAQTVACRHEALAVGERGPACGRGRLYQLPPGIARRLDGQALLSAVRYELEKRRCSACGQVFTAALPGAAGTAKYRARARAVLALGRSYLGVPLYRLAGYPALVGVPVPEATQGDLLEEVGDCAFPGFKYWERRAAQSEVSYQDDTAARVLTLLAENRQPDAPERTGRYTTGLIAEVEGQRICLYYAGRHPAGENLAALLRLREPQRDNPRVRSDATAVKIEGWGNLVIWQGKTTLL
jgi:transposase